MPSLMVSSTSRLGPGRSKVEHASVPPDRTVSIATCHRRFSNSVVHVMSLFGTARIVADWVAISSRDVSHPGATLPRARRGDLASPVTVSRANRADGGSSCLRYGRPSTWSVIVSRVRSGCRGSSRSNARAWRACVSRRPSITRPARPAALAAKSGGRSPSRSARSERTSQACPPGLRWAEMPSRNRSRKRPAGSNTDRSKSVGASAGTQGGLQTRMSAEPGGKGPSGANLAHSDDRSEGQADGIVRGTGDGARVRIRGHDARRTPAGQGRRPARRSRSRCRTRSGPPSRPRRPARRPARRILSGSARRPHNEGGPWL